MEVARASRRGEESILIGHAVTRKWKGQWVSTATRKGECSGRIARRCVETDGQKRREALFMTQTTLSVDDTSDVIDALLNASRKLSVRAKMTSATPLLPSGSGTRSGRTGGSGAGGRLKNSSNSNRLAELAQRMGKRGF